MFHQLSSKLHKLKGCNQPNRLCFKDLEMPVYKCVIFVEVFHFADEISGLYSKQHSCFGQ